MGLGLGTNTLSAGEVMDRHRGGPGFDWLRIGLSLSVITLHCFHIAYGMRTETGAELARNWSSPIWAATLPVFFAASGFMVAGSALRTRNIVTFMWFRALRIVPALCVEVTLSALVLGSLVTTLTLREYFSSPGTFVYFGNIIGWIHYHLPGVFLGNPEPGVVNRNLWTLHPELFSYLLMVGAMATGLVYKLRPVAIVWGIFSLALIAMQLRGTSLLNGVFTSPVLVYSFVSGVLFYHLRYKLPVSKVLGVAAGVVAYVLLKTDLYILSLPLLYYGMVVIGMMQFPRIAFLQNGDYSYGLYLYGYPIQQLVVWFLPPQMHEWYIVFIIAVPLTLAFAMISWNVVEKPTLRFKHLVKKAPPPIASQTEPPLEDERVAATRPAQPSVETSLRPN